MRSLVLICVSLLAGCAATPPSELVWSRSETDGHAHLAFAAPESDWVVLTLSCEIGSGVIEAAGPFADSYADARFENDQWVDREGRAQPWTVTARVRSGRSAETVQARAIFNEMDGGAWVAAPLPVRSATARSFARSGRITLQVGRERLTPPPAPEPAGYVALCGGG